MAKDNDKVNLKAAKQDEEKEQRFDTQMSEQIQSEQFGIHNESLRVQKAEWVKQQVERQREIEDETRQVLQEEQRILDELRRSTVEYMERTREMSKYNADCQEQMREQVYALNGLSEDKLQGMKEYKNAYYQGFSLAAFILSLALVALCGYLEGFNTEITMFMLAFAGIEGALLSQESKRGRILDAICRFLNLLMLPAMITIFICYELEFPEYQVLLPIFVVAGMVILMIGTMAYFVYNPYRKEKKKIRDAKADLKEIEQKAEKAVKKNQKRRKKKEAKLARIQKREEERMARLQRREETRLVRKKQREEARRVRLQRKEEAKLAGLQQRGKVRLPWLQKNEEILDAAEVTPLEEENAGNEVKPDKKDDIMGDKVKVEKEEINKKDNLEEETDSRITKLKVVEKMQ